MQPDWLLMMPSDSGDEADNQPETGVGSILINLEIENRNIENRKLDKQ